MKMDETELPLLTHKADGTKLEKTLSKEILASVTKDLSQAMDNLKTDKKAAAKLEKQKTTKTSKAKHTEKDKDKGKDKHTELNPEDVKAMGEPKLNHRKEAERIAAKRLVQSLTTPVSAPEPKRRGRPAAKNKAR